MSAELFRVSEQGQVGLLAERPFADEVGDLEDFVAKNPQLVGEGIKIFGRQVTAGVGRIDLLAIDQAFGEGQMAVIELKNVPADVGVLLQVLRYASWVMSNPDSIRLLLEKERIKATQLELKPKLVIVAPRIEEDLVELTQYLTDSFEFDLIELRRFEQGDEYFAVVNRRTPAGSGLPPGITVREDWSWEKYGSELTWKPERVMLGQALYRKVEERISEKGWPLRARFRKGYIPFQLGGTRNVIGIEPRWANGFSVWFRLPSPPEELGIPTPAGLQSSWSSNFKIYYLNITDPDFELGQLDNLFDAAYEATGRP